MSQLMTSKYEAVKGFIIAQANALGNASPIVENARNSQVHHLIASFKKMKPDHADATSMLTTLSADKSGAFTDEQRHRLSEVVSEVMHGDLPAADDSSMTQTHLYTYEYYSHADWDIFTNSSVSLRNKIEHMLRQWIAFGLLNPSEPTCRIGLATILVANATELSPTDAYDTMKDLKATLKVLREKSGRPRTMRTFPMDVKDFVMLYPNVYANDAPPVACKMDTSSIRLMSDKSRIPCRASNRTVARGTSVAPRQSSSFPTSSTAALPSSSQAPTDLLMQMVNFMMRSNGQGDVPITVFNQQNRQSPPSRPSSSAAGGSAGGAPVLALTDAPAQVQGLDGVGAGLPRASTIPTITDGLLGGGPVATMSPTASSFAPSQDRMLALVGQHIEQKSTKRRRYNSKTNPGAEEELAAAKASMLEDDGGSGVRVAPLKKPAAAAAPVAAKPAAPATSIAGLPPLNMSGSNTRWGGGRLYCDAAKMLFRVYRRAGDKADTKVSFRKDSSEAGLQAAWAKACEKIVQDARPAAA